LRNGTIQGKNNLNKRGNYKNSRSQPLVANESKESRIIGISFRQHKKMLINDKLMKLPMRLLIMAPANSEKPV